MSRKVLALLVGIAVIGPSLGSELSAPVQAARTRSAPVLDVDYERSSLVAKIAKGGLLRFLGHEHGVIPAEWSAEVHFDPQDLAGSGIVVEISAPRLIVDSAEARRRAGVDPDGPSESEVEEIRARMLSDEQLDAETFPVIRFESDEVRLRSENKLLIAGTLTLHGVERRLEVDTDLAPDGSGYVVRGSFQIGQRDFGIEPVSIGGVVKVANDIQVSFEIFASRR